MVVGSVVRVRTVPIEVTDLGPDLRILDQSAVVAQVQLRGNSRTLESIEGASLTARANVRSLPEGIHDVGLEVGRPMPLGVTVEAIWPERITMRLRLVNESGMNPKPGP